MPVFGQSRDCYLSGSPVEGTCYAQLKPVALDATIGSLIYNSTNIMCPPDDCCSGYHHSQSETPNYYMYSSDDSSGVSPHSPQKDLSDIQEVLQRRMTPGCREDDDESVVYDFEDLDFLDPCSRDRDTDYPTSISRHHQSVIVEPGYPYYRPSPHAHSPYSSPAMTSYSSSSSSSSLTSPHIRYNKSSTPSAQWSTVIHYYDSPTPIVAHTHHYPRPHPPPLSLSHSPHYPSTPSPSPSSRSHEMGMGIGMLPLNSRPLLSSSSSLSFDMEEEVEDDDEDAEYKPYCDSRRGAKKNLLWKFLLLVLDNHPELAQWTDVRKGVFKFVDTARISTMWGHRKHKRDMTFEKLSRGIRHYYKRGLMERISNTRLVYKFNWDKVPKRYRKF